MLPLEPKSIRVLIYLLEHRDRAVSKDELLRAVWQDTAVTDNALTRVIAQLRRELVDDARNPRYIQTIPTLGYRFVAEVGATLAAPPEVAAPVPQPLPARQRRWWPLVVALPLVVAGGVLWATVGRTRDREAPRQSSARQMTTSAGLDFGSSFSPDARRFTYSSDKSGRFEVYVRDLESGAGERQLTSDGGQNIQPVWSPDGRQIAWHSVTRRGIWVAPADGSGVPRQVVKWGSQPAWSPDSQRIAFRSDDVHSLSVYDLISAAKTSIQVARVDGAGAPVTIASTGPAPGRQAFPTWSPDGKRVLFSASRGNAGELWTVDPDGKSAGLLLRRERNVFISPVYSPSGDSLYFGALSKTRDLESGSRS